MLRSYSSRIALPALFVALSTMAYGVDGVVLIDQNRALAGNVTPGDAPGFPVSITRPGSYKLSGNLTVGDVNAQGIVISADHVTIDLNGFAILGPATCSPTCSVSTAGIGITTALTAEKRVNITVRNGTIQGMGGSGINLRGSSHLVEYMHVRGNGGNGIIISSADLLTSSVVQHNIVENNGVGITLQEGIVSHNTVSANRAGGISVAVGWVIGNFISLNKGIGLFIGSGDGGARDNLLDDNQVTGPDAVGGVGVNAGQNSCDGSQCAF
jgi:parallel beta helix pectate lyase-like protein